MGCDIHLAVERRNGNGWERVLPPPEAYDPWLQSQAAEHPNDAYYQTRLKSTWFDDRNYNLFAILAGVRNNYDITPISDPRGLPDDLSREVRRLDYVDTTDEVVAEDDDNDVWLGDHSQSWLTLAELLAYDWNGSFSEGGWVDVKNFQLWLQRGKKRPDSWSGAVGGGAVEHLSWRDMKHYIEDGYITFTESDPRGYTCILDSIRKQTFYAYVEWPITYQEAAGRFYAQILPELQKLGSPEDVRIVFGFDS